MIGTSLKRFEDHRLLTGKGRFTDDIALPDQTFAVFVRSPHAHADIAAIDSSAARALPGVLGVWTADDLAKDGLNGIGGGIPAARKAEYPNRDGTLMGEPPIQILAKDRVRHVGEAVTLVVAECPEIAEAAAELVAVDYRPRAVVTATTMAADPAAPQLWPAIARNLSFDYAAGDSAATDRALASAARIVVHSFVNSRVVPGFIEPRAAVASHNQTEGFLLQVGCQSVHGIRRQLAQTLRAPNDSVRIVSRDVGGAFGGRSVLYPEYVALLWAAHRLGRPVKWTARRSEEFSATTQGRDTVVRGELGLDRDGKFVGLRVNSIANLGARHAGNGPFSIIRNFEKLLSGVYDIPAVAMTMQGVFTNTTPVSSYRGVGRMEANFLIERLIDKAARETGIDRVDLRRRNLIPSSAMPHDTAMGATYDSGDYSRSMDLALAAADWGGFADRRKASAKQGKLRGISLTNYIEGAGGSAGEYADVAIATNGTITIGAGCVAQGQGHETTLRQVAADAFSVAVETIAVKTSDTGQIRRGFGSNASRSMVRAGTALTGAMNAALEIGKTTAARLLQSEPDAVDFFAGVYRVKGAPQRTVGLFEVARARADEQAASSWTAEFDDDTEAVTYPNGCHVCEVEIDPETGAVAIVSFIAVDDVGRAVNPMIVHGQSQGGIAQGVGQALMEHNAYDAESGQLLTGSFLDYAMPHAHHLPSLKPIQNDVPSPTNPLGVKGAGEGGATGAPSAVINAVLDALAATGVDDIEMPATPARIWTTIKNARGKID